MDGRRARPADHQQLPVSPEGSRAQRLIDSGLRGRAPLERIEYHRTQRGVGDVLGRHRAHARARARSVRVSEVTGRLPRMLGAVDMGWLVGSFMAGAVYALLSRSFDPSRESSATLESQRALASLEAEQVSP